MRFIEKLEPYQSSSTSIDGYCWEYRPNLEDVINKVNEIIDVVNDTETVRHGRWIWTQYDGNPTIGNSHCSVCGQIAYRVDRKNYCPNCGAKMDEVKE